MDTEAWGFFQQIIQRLDRIADTLERIEHQPARQAAAEVQAAGEMLKRSEETSGES